MKIFVLLVFASFLFCDELDVQNRRLKNQALELLENKFSENDPKKSLAPPSQNIEFEALQTINIIGNSILKNSQLIKFKRQFSNNISNLSQIEFARQTLENLYLDAGYTTTRVRVNLEFSDLKSGILCFEILEGMIEKYTYNGQEKPFKTFLSFPKSNNKMLNLRDLDQASENLNNANLQIIPAQTLGQSVVDVNLSSPKFGGSLGYNNFGTTNLGRHKAKIDINSFDLLGLNETFYAFYERKLARHTNGKNSQTYLFSSSFPIQYFRAFYNFERSEYKQPIYGFWREYSANGTTNTNKFGIAFVPYRNSDHKFELSTELALKNIDNYIDEIKLSTSSRNLSVIKAGITHTGRVFSSLVSSEIFGHWGIHEFGASSDNEIWQSDTSPKAKFNKFSANLSIYKPLGIVYLKEFVAGQISKDILYSNEKLSLGDDSSVRGFRNSGISGESGFYARNEIGVNLTTFARPFVAYDIGRTKDNTTKNYDTIQGVSVGLKGEFKSLFGTITLSKATNYPKDIKTNSHEIYATVQWRL